MWIIFIMTAAFALSTMTACGLSGGASAVSDGGTGGGGEVSGVGDSGGGSNSGGEDGGVIIVEGADDESEDEEESPVEESDSEDEIPEQTERLQIVNKCSYTIWIQQQNMPSGTPSVVELTAGGSVQYIIPDRGLAATRLWPKKDCDADGHNCTMGQSSSPCPESGCPPPVDSKFEATWGCVLADTNECAENPSAPGIKLSGDTYWNTSAVDGFTFPFTATLTGNTLPAEICSPVDCSALTMDECPVNEDLSVGVGGELNALYSSVDLTLFNGGGDVIGCNSPCAKLTYPTYGGYWLSNIGTEAAMYCCPTPPVSPAECSAGPVEDTLFVSRVRSMCGGTVYTYAYDDAAGLRQCSGVTQVRFTIGPNCP